MTFSHGYVTLIEAETYILVLGFIPFDYPGLAETYAELIDSLTFADSAASTEPPSVPVALCPGEAGSELTWTCEENSRDGVTIVQIFVPVERTLRSWLTHRQRSNPGQVSLTRRDITVAGHPGAIWLNDCSPQYYREVHVAVHNGDRVFWWQHYAYNEASIVALR